MPIHLDRCGMNVFIDNYEFFATRPSLSEAVKYFASRGKNESGAGRSRGNAKIIFDNPNLLREALEYIAYTAPKAKPHQKEKAIKLLKGL